MNNVDLTFDGPEPEKEPWPRKLVVSLVIFGAVIATCTLFWTGFWISTLTADHNHIPTFGPITFKSPMLIVDENGNVPAVPNEDVPPPAFVAHEDAMVPVLIDRTVDCAAHDCPEGGMPVLATVSWEEVSTDDVVISSFPIVTDFGTNYNEGDDYILGTQVQERFSIRPFEFTEKQLAYIREEEKSFSAWRLRGNTIADRPDAIAAGWTSQVIHVVWEGD